METFTLYKGETEAFLGMVSAQDLWKKCPKLQADQWQSVRPVYFLLSLSFALKESSFPPSFSVDAEAEERRENRVSLWNYMKAETSSQIMK